MNAIIIAVGTEMLGTSRLDTNSLKLTEILERYSIPLRRKEVIGDSKADIIRAVQSASEDADLLLITGGLGPTEDDLTKEALAEGFGLELTMDETIVKKMEERFKARGFVMSPLNRKQANVFAGHQTLANSRGTAPGAHLTLSIGRKEKHVWVFPGVPVELEAMIAEALEPWLQSTGVTTSRHRRVLKIAGMPESAVDEKLAPFYAAHREDPVTILATHGEIQIHLLADGTADESFARLTSMERELRAIFGERIFGLDDETMESVVGKLLSSRGETVSTAESCTGGLLASRITDVGGSSAYFIGGVVAYSYQAKLFLVGVDPALIQEHGEVSEEVAREMASGVRRRFGTTYGMGITGIAGPTGGTDKKPVGTVHIAVASATNVEHRKIFFHGSRDLIKRYSTQSVLDLMRLTIQRGAGKKQS